jgi:hypothetical protein
MFAPIYQRVGEEIKWARFLHIQWGVRQHGGMNMLHRSLKSVWILSVLLVLVVPVWAQRGAGRGMQRADNRGLCLAMITSMPKQSLDSTEMAGLVYLREEEKLAHDVYAKLQARWGMRIFANIAQGEERHADSIKMLLTRYELTDPAANNPLGVFQNEGLQVLYHDLVRQGESSLKAALRAGAEIEDLDIRDLEKAIAAADNEDLKLVYRNLLNASKNHLRSFAGQLQVAGESYRAQYLSPSTLADILASPKQAGMRYGARGNGRRGMGRGNNGVCPRAQP